MDDGVAASSQLALNPRPRPPGLPKSRKHTSDPGLASFSANKLSPASQTRSQRQAKRLPSGHVAGAGGRESGQGWGGVGQAKESNEGKKKNKKKKKKERKR